MKENVKLIKENVEYKMLNGIRRKYNLYQVDNTIVTRDCSMDMQFDERYRPRTIDEIIMIEQHKKQFRGWIKKGIIPDTLMYEPKGGTGKTTMSQVLADENESSSLEVPLTMGYSRNYIIKDCISIGYAGWYFGSTV